MDPKTGEPALPKPSLPITIPEDEIGKPHRFWDSQPVPKVTEALPDECGPISEKRVEEVRPEPYALPEGFSWGTVDVKKGEDLDELHFLLEKHYVEDDGCCFRFDYSRECLQWALALAPVDWCICVRATTPENPNKLVGFLSGLPVPLVVHDKQINAAEVNFLCVHKSLRSKRLAPVLIKELTRRINLSGIWQALYTAGIFIPRPITDCRYYHRNINFSKLLAVGFTALRPGQTLQEAVDAAALPTAFTKDRVRPMVAADVASVHRLLIDGFKKDGIKLWFNFSQHEIQHMLLPQENVVYSYVRENQDRTDITDFFSFYSLPSTVLRYNQTHTKLQAAYNFYCNGTTMTRTDLLEQSIIAAKMQGFDVFNALDLHHNLPAFRPLQFGPGDGSLKYYLFNFKCPLIEPCEVGTILL